MTTERKELAVQDTTRSVALLSAESINTTLEQLKMLDHMVKAVLQADADYGKIPGTDKDTLLKPGADNICAAYRLYPKPYVLDKTLDLDRGYLSYAVRVELISLVDGMVKTEGVGECNSYEEKYRYRQQARKCPQCGKEAIIKGKEEYGGGWLCFKRKDGCGAKFREQDPAIVAQQAGRVVNPDPLNQANTILKMAEKRAYVDATLHLPGVARFFTQDLDDLAKGAAEEVSDEPPQAQQQQQQQRREEPTRSAAKAKPEHWCEVHQTVWFKRGKMTGYGHPIEEGKPWCHESASEPGTQAHAQRQEVIDGTATVVGGPKPNPVLDTTDPASVAAIFGRKEAEFQRYGDLLNFAAIDFKWDKKRVLAELAVERLEDLVETPKNLRERYHELKAKAGK